MLHEFDIGVAKVGCPKRINEVLIPWQARAPTQPALIESGHVLSYGELAEAVGATRAWLAEKGVRPGDRVMIVNENSAATIVLLLATAALNAWAVPVGARLSDREIDLIRAHSGARRVIYTIAASPLAAAHARRHEAGTEPLPKGCGPVAVSALDSACAPEPLEPNPARRVAVLVYTSGTTGQPKAVMLTHRNLLFMAEMSGAIRQLGPGDRFYAVLPVSHIVGLAVVLLGSLLYGASIQLCPRFHPTLAARALAYGGVSIMLGVPSMYALLAEYAEVRGSSTLPHPHLRAIGACGAPLDPAIKHAAERVLGMPLHNGYGITECSPTISQTRLEEPRSDCSVGRILPGVEAKLVGPDGAAVPAGTVGELRVRGPNVMRGYYKAPAETAAVIDEDGWFNTQDLARFENGNLFIVGRSRELIIRFGFNVYPAEIEAVLNHHPAVLQSAVIGRAVRGDEEIIAFVQPVAGATPAIADIAHHAAAALAPYKRPTRIVLVSSLPTSASGKIRKAELAQLAVGLGCSRV
ncbi:MAG: class I adenylate-forming enzyme family protein [Acetobacteraceae bacterium]